MAEAPPPLEVLLELAKSAFRGKYGHEATVMAYAPGRVNLIGEHTDYNEGLVFPMVGVHERRGALGGGKGEWDYEGLGSREVGVVVVAVQF